MWCSETHDKEAFDTEISYWWTLIGVDPENQLVSARLRQDVAWFRYPGTWYRLSASTASRWGQQGETSRSQLSASLNIESLPRVGCRGECVREDKLTCEVLSRTTWRRALHMWFWRAQSSTDSTILSSQQLFCAKMQASKFVHLSRIAYSLDRIC